MVETLPTELVELIIESLYFDRTTLLNCALVARAWVRSSQRGIFRQIIIELPGQQRDIDDYNQLTGQLVESFNIKPPLATYVHCLGIQWNTPYEDSMHSAANIIIHRLSNVKELSFSAIHWTRLPSCLQASLADLVIRAPSLTRICFTDSCMSSYAELASILSHAKHLKALNVDISFKTVSGGDAIPESDSDEKAKYMPRSIQLDELTLDGDPRSITWFQRDWCPIDVRDLQTLSLVIFDTSESKELVKLAGRNLKELRLTCAVWSSLDGYLEYTPNLKILYLDLTGGQYHLNYVTVIQDILGSLLNDEGKTFPLQHLIIMAGPAFVHPMNPLDPWIAIDALARRPEFGLLETVQVDWVLHHTTVPHGFERSFRRHLPFLQGTGKLMVNVFKELE